MILIVLQPFDLDYYNLKKYLLKITISTYSSELFFQRRLKGIINNKKKNFLVTIPKKVINSDAKTIIQFFIIKNNFLKIITNELNNKINIKK
tara:strand:+ start:969 stop:1244 length:276 start_codon:yes stop_codon:yes gene_type:complete